ncbi:DUF2970 domain-containing protein [Chitinimonas sp. BJB300]|uniref:DUF2970 domain-containing protein n=1 Tax=Chitinimonas sp. BJB300 TaxID=1559339 RepID=UPI000C0F9447|nr:DUF2970 domain-containing protein [Chitinimonas sp. BJB300]PHV11610.1 hypothetical protein CSQ89_10125 [Chitinimonas sp. BJB300]TSJ88098.1 DUF2970 domain-containing protein [Chitinimonas sp. BJB300]
MDNQPPKPSMNPFKAIGAVLAAFTGIRRGKDSKGDLQKLSPVQIILAGLICAAVFIGSLILLVRSIVPA